MQAGIVLRSVLGAGADEVEIQGLGYDEAMDALKSAARPLRLTFYGSPGAARAAVVPAAAAAAGEQGEGIQGDGGGEQVRRPSAACPRLG